MCATACLNDDSPDLLFTPSQMFGLFCCMYGLEMFIVHMESFNEG